MLFGAAKRDKFGGEVLKIEGDVSGGEDGSRVILHERGIGVVRANLRRNRQDGSLSAASYEEEKPAEESQNVTDCPHH